MSYLIPVVVRCDGHTEDEERCETTVTVHVPVEVVDCQDGDRVARSHTVLALDHRTIPLPEGWDVVSKRDEWGRQFCSECKRP